MQRTGIDVGMSGAARWLPLDELRPWEKNPRRNDPAVPRVAASIRRFGFVAPIVVWPTGNRMVAGHTRLKAIRALLAEDPNFVPKGAPGPGLVRVVFHDFESEADANAYALADNRLGEIAEWDHEAVADVLTNISAEDRVVIGFEKPIVIEEEAKPAAPKPLPKPDPQKLGRWAIVHGDALEVLKGYPDNHFDALLSDPPYGISFMGKGWDYGLPSIEIWRETLRVLKPGAPVVTFSATRTFHRLAVSLEDAGFEIRDCFSWLYGEGFPKSLDVSKAIDEAAGATREVVGTRKLTGNAAYKDGEASLYNALLGGVTGSKEIPVTAPATDLAQQWDGYGTALKPAWEPAILARKPLDGTVAANVARWGVGGLAIDACRIGEGGQLRWEKPRDMGFHGGSDAGPCAALTSDAGRWPANVLLDEHAAAMLDAQTGDLGKSQGGSRGGQRGLDYAMRAQPDIKPGYGDTGGASRFFYVCKPSRREREAGCEDVWSCPSCIGNKWDSEDRSRNAQTGATSLARGISDAALEPVSDLSTSSSGSDITDLSRRAIRSTTSTATSRTTGSTTSPSSPPSSTSDSTRDASSSTASGGSRAASAVNASPSPPNTGTSPTDIPRTAAVARVTFDASSLTSRCAVCGAELRSGNLHSTVKPITLARYLATLLLPPARDDARRRLLVPFCGSGSEVIGGLLAGWDDVVGIEREAEYVAIANARVGFYAEHPDEADVVDDEPEDEGDDCGDEAASEPDHSETNAESITAA